MSGMPGETNETTCRNCGYRLLPENRFCPNCSQDTHSHKQPLKHFIVEALENTLHFDTKFFNTVRDLFTRPGQLTINFNSDMRARYVPPVRFYIFTSFIFFFVLSFTYEPSIKIQQPTIELEDSSAVPESEKPFVLTNQELVLLSSDADKLDARVDSVLISKGSEPDLLNRVILKLLANTASGKLNSPEFKQQVLKNISISLFFLMPIFAWLLMLIYRRSKKFYTEHLVFSLHFHTLLFLLLLVVTPIDRLLNFDLTLLVIIGLIVYLFFALRNVYGQQTGKTILKTSLLLLSYCTFVAASFLISTVLSMI